MLCSLLHIVFLFIFYLERGDVYAWGGSRMGEVGLSRLRMLQKLSFLEPFGPIVALYPGAHHVVAVTASTWSVCCMQLCECYVGLCFDALVICVVVS